MDALGEKLGLLLFQFRNFNNFNNDKVRERQRISVSAGTISKNFKKLPAGVQARGRDTEQSVAGRAALVLTSSPVKQQPETIQDGFVT